MNGSQSPTNNVEIVHLKCTDSPQDTRAWQDPTREVAWISKKTEKLAQDAAKGRFARHGPAPVIAFLGILAPGRPRARSQ